MLKEGWQYSGDEFLCYGGKIKLKHTNSTQLILSSKHSFEIATNPTKGSKSKTKVHS